MILKIHVRVNLTLIYERFSRKWIRMRIKILNIIAVLNDLKSVKWQLLNFNKVGYILILKY